MTGRRETDSIGAVELPADALYGINAFRAYSNFPRSGLPVYPDLFKALAQVKLSCALVNTELGYLEPNIGTALVSACEECADGLHIEHFIVDPMQGGAGTSSNMNINEIIASLASLKSGKPVHPLEHVNLHQSTNDVYPTALKIAVYRGLERLENAVNGLQLGLQQKERELADVVKIGRTELMPAVPTTLGREFSAYAEAVSRDRWRVFKSRERIRQINLGGTAIGSGTAAPRKYILSVSRKLAEITGLPLSRAENMTDATQNHDQLQEAFGMIKTSAVNLEKIANDLRYMASIGEIVLPPVQMGSSIMPGKFNPVIPEMVSSVAKKVFGNELTASLCFSSGELELNAFLPLAGQMMLESTDIMTQAVELFTKKCVSALSADRALCARNLLISPSTAAILIPVTGHEKASAVARHMADTGADLKTAASELNAATPAEIDTMLKPENICAMGYRDE